MQRAGAAALPFFCDHLLQHRLVEAEVGNEPFELRVFFAQLPQLANLGRSHRAEFLLPSVKRSLGDPELADDLRDRRTGFGLA